MIKNDFRNVFKVLKEINYALTQKQKITCFCVFFMILFGAFLETLGVSLILPLAQALIAPRELMSYPVVNRMLQIFGIKDNGHIVLFVGIFFATIFIVKNLYLMYLSHKQIKIRWDMQCELSAKMLESYMARPYTYFLDTNSSRILRGVTDDVGCLYNIIEYMFTGASSGLTIIMIVVFLFISDFRLALLISLLGGITVFVIMLTFRAALKGVGTRQRDANAEQRMYAYQAVNGMKEIYVMDRRSFFVAKFKHANEKAKTVNTLFFSLNAIPTRIVELVCICLMIGIILVAYGRGNADSMFVSKLVVFIAAGLKLLPQIGILVSVGNSFIYYWKGVDATYDNLISAESYEKDRADLQSSKLGDVVIKAEDLKVEELILNDITWKYPRADRNVLDGLNVRIRKNESVGIIGASGSGKTTLSDIIMGLYKPQAGSVEVDGIDIFAIPEIWSKKIGYVPQDVFMTDDTIRANVTFGIYEDEIDDKKVWAALEMSQLKDYVDGLSDGIYTRVGERGIKLSGGQRQRIAIARALYYNPSILVLDEATSALDNETEKAVMESIESLLGQKTLIIIAHRLSTISKCDTIYEIVEGKAIKREKESIFG